MLWEPPAEWGRLDTDFNDLSPPLSMITFEIVFVINDAIILGLLMIFKDMLMHGSIQALYQSHHLRGVKNPLRSYQKPIDNQCPPQFSQQKMWPLMVSLNHSHQLKP